MDGLLALQGIDNIVGLCDFCHLKSYITSSKREGTVLRANSLTVLYCIVFLGLVFPTVISPILKMQKMPKETYFETRPYHNVFLSQMVRTLQAYAKYIL